MVQANLQMSSTESHAHVPFFRRRWVQTILPMGTSLAVHLGIAIIGYSVYRVAVNYVPHVIVQERPVDNVDYSPPPGAKFVDNPVVGKGNTDQHKLGNTDFADVESPKFDPNKSKSLQQTLSGGEPDAEIASMIGPGARRGPGGPDSGLTMGPVGDGTLVIGRPDGIENGGGPTVFRTPRSAKKIVFVCDATGSMNTIFGGLRHELQETIKNLQVQQSFNVIFFSDDKVLSLNPQSLMLATAGNKTKAYDFLSDISPRGLTNPIPAIRAAFAQEPELMYVLTDGFDQVESLESVYNEFATLNKAGKVKVNTILIGTTEQKDLVDILKRIANDNRGTLKIVGRDAF